VRPSSAAIFLVVLGGCSHAPPGAGARSSPAPALQKLPLERTFAELRTQRARVAAAPRSEPFEIEPTVALDVLVGVERARFADELGPPKECYQVEGLGMVGRIQVSSRLTRRRVGQTLQMRPSWTTP